jgi:medium-chain acyl-[acyl-carrier-protein] hydrolase
MNSKKIIWSQEYCVSTFLVNPQKKLGLFGLLNLIQDTAWIHATHLGHGYEAMINKRLAWVLTRQKIVMQEWPLWGDTIELRTWIRPGNGIVAVRDFEIVKSSEVIGLCTTQWLILDIESRRPLEKKMMLEYEARLDAAAQIDATKIQINKNLNQLASFNVRNSDLDLNGHVNNTKYAQWILDSVPYEKHSRFILNEYEVNFLSETRAGDVISILSGETSDDRFQFQGVRLSDNKNVFAATMKVSAGQLAPLNNHS